MNKLVSILTPCYNGEKYLDNYFQDILQQDYSNCEIIFVDDGSIDSTSQIVSRYRPLIEKKGYVLKYYYQENAGQGIAIANGIKKVMGEYLVWPDCDDRLSKDSISKRVKYLEEHPEYGIVRSEGTVVDEKEPERIIKYISDKSKHRFEEHLFENYLFGNCAWLQPGSFMIRVSALDRANPDRYIYPIRYGQNWQMLLPVMYYYKCGYIDEPLFTYILHRGSASDCKGKTYQYLISHEKMYYEIISETVKHMQIPEADQYLKRLEIYYLRRYLTVSYTNSNENEVKLYYNKLRQLKAVRFKDFLKAKSLKFKVSHTLYRRIVGK